MMKRLTQCTLVIISTVLVGSWLLIACGCSDRNISTVQREVDAIVLGVKSYQAEYGKWPVGSANGSASTLILILSGDDSQAANPKRIVFYAPPRYQNGQNRLTDPFGHEYRVVIDIIGSGYVNVDRQSLPHTVVVWSIGKNGIDEFGGGDDIHSWRH